MTYSVDLRKGVDSASGEDSLLLCDEPGPLHGLGVGAGQKAPVVDPDPEVILFNLKRRYTGVSATVNALAPLQATQWRLGYCGTPLPNGLPGSSLTRALWMSRKASRDRQIRIWHVRRDHEMVAGLFARDILRLPVRLVFTSAAQHRHGGFPRWLISRMDAVISTTPLAASFVPNTTAVVPHGIDLKRFSLVADKRIAWAASGLPGQFGIGVFGRIRPDKGTDLFVEAMLRALPLLPHAHAVIAGLAKGSDQAFLRSLQEKIQSAGLSSRITFLGEVPAGEVHVWYQRCLVCVACPRYEPFGLTPFEAAATGCALVCSRTGAFEQLVDPGVNGQLVPTNDFEQLTQALVNILSDPTHAMQMGQNARQVVADRFSLAAEAAGIARVYESLFEAR
jgi:mannosyltransferase